MSGWGTAALMWIGAVFMLLAATGIVRLPDTFTRMQASTKAATLGVSSMMLATAVHFGDMGVTVRALTTVLFLFATAPIAAHLIARVAYLVGAQLWQGTRFDELREWYDVKRHEAASSGAPPEPLDTTTERRVGGPRFGRRN